MPVTNGRIAFRRFLGADKSTGEIDQPRRDGPPSGPDLSGEHREHGAQLVA